MKAVFTMTTTVYIILEVVSIILKVHCSNAGGLNHSERGIHHYDDGVHHSGGVICRRALKRILNGVSIYTKIEKLKSTQSATGWRHKAGWLYLQCAGAVVRASEKLDEVWSPSSLDAVTFHVNQLYRLLLVYCDDDHILEDVGKSIALLTEIEDGMEELGHVGYVLNLIHSQTRRGRPKLDIHKEQLQHLLQLYFTCPKIAALLGVSLRTVRRRMTEYGLSVSGLYSDISNCELDRLVDEICGSFPNCGYRMMDGHLRQRGIRVTQARIRNSMH